jgi:hypothetical protein
MAFRADPQPAQQRHRQEEQRQQNKMQERAVS